MLILKEVIGGYFVIIIDIKEYISADAKFPPNIWSRFSATTVRTTNGCESYHSRLNLRFYMLIFLTL
jgi:hypothetical protein